MIVNPIAGTDSKDVIVPRIISRFDEKNLHVDVRYTAAKGHATDLALQAVDEGYDAVAVCGGDGTVNEAARAMCDSGVPMAILPSGSGNGLARHIGLGADGLAAVDFVEWENIRDCDYGLVDGNKFFCTFGIGFDAAVAKKFAEDGHRGFKTYLKDAFLEFSRYEPKHYTLTIDGVSLDTKAYLVAVCNASQYGNNAYIAPQASITDGLFDVIIMNDAPKIQTLMAGVDMLTGMLPHNKQIQIFRAKNIVIEPHASCPAHIDGEPFGPLSRYDLSIVPGKLRLFTNPARKKFKPFITPIDSLTKDLSSSILKLFEK